MAFSYLKQEIPENYKCSKCPVTDCKLWRQYQTFANHIELLCVDCALKDQKKKGKGWTVDEQGYHKDKFGDRSDQIGWLVPAVPDEENETFWGYTSVPLDGCNWWRKLPLRATSSFWARILPVLSKKQSG